LHRSIVTGRVAPLELERADLHWREQPEQHRVGHQGVDCQPHRDDQTIEGEGTHELGDAGQIISGNGGDGARDQGEDPQRRDQHDQVDETDDQSARALEELEQRFRLRLW
jgi:hypothetical protein